MSSQTPKLPKEGVLHSLRAALDPIQTAASKDRVPLPFRGSLLDHDTHSHLPRGLGILLEGINGPIRSLSSAPLRICQLRPGFESRLHSSFATSSTMCLSAGTFSSSHQHIMQQNDPLFMRRWANGPVTQTP